MLDGGFVQVSTAARETGTDIPHERLAKDNIAIIKPGYVYIYLSNENGDLVEVFFDDFRVEHIQGTVVQVDDYYPFGLTFNSYSRENSVPNMYQYNGKEKQDELDLGWLDYGARMYMPELGRWFSVDIKAEAYYPISPYQYVLNNPIVNIDVKGQWTVTRHYNMTFSSLSAAGIGKKQADLLAHYSSVYADNPGGNIWWNNIGHPSDQNYYRYKTIDYTATENSQKTDWNGSGYNYNIWHSMRSGWEKSQYDAGMGGISAEGAMQRGMAFGWAKVFESAKYGKLGDLKVNSKGMQAWGQGSHALQDAYAHKGTTMNEHSVFNDRYGDTSEAREITNSAVMVHSIMSGDTDAFNKMVEGGNTSLNLEGISGDNLLQLIDKVKANGGQLKYNWDTGKYDVN